MTNNLTLGGTLTVKNLSDPRKIAQCTGAVSGQFAAVAPANAVTYVVNGKEVWVKKNHGTVMRVQ